MVDCSDLVFFAKNEEISYNKVAYGYGFELARKQK